MYNPTLSIASHQETLPSPFYKWPDWDLNTNCQCHLGLDKMQFGPVSSSLKSRILFTSHVWPLKVAVIWRSSLLAALGCPSVPSLEVDTSDLLTYMQETRSRLHDEFLLLFVLSATPLPQHWNSLWAGSSVVLSVTHLQCTFTVGQVFHLIVMLLEKTKPYCYWLCWLGENIIANPLLVLFSRQMRDYLSGFQEQCDVILSDVSSALQHLESLQKQYLFVSNKTGTLHDACEQLLKEQVMGSREREGRWAF